MKYANKDGKLSVTRNVHNEDGDVVRTDATLYTLEYLNSQEEAITAQRDQMIALKESELAQVRALKDKCAEFDVVLVERVAE